MASDPTLNEFEVVFGRVRGLLLTQETVQHAVDLLAEAARDVIPGALGAGVTLITEGRPTSTGATDSVVARADALQYELGEGPCLTAWADSAPVLIEDARTDPRWPRWSEAVEEIPVRSSLSVPLLRGRGSLGALKVYSAEPAAFHAGTEALLVRFAASAAALLGHVQTTETPRRIQAELAAALRSRDVVGMARGILMSRYRLSEEEAFLRLISTARESGTSMAAVARGLVERPPAAGELDET
jgi:GAF domain-containing protein